MYYNLNTHTHTHTLMVNFMGRLDWALSQMPGRGIFAVPSLEQFLHICPCTAESRDFPFMSTWDFFHGLYYTYVQGKMVTQGEELSMLFIRVWRGWMFKTVFTGDS